MLYCSGIVCFDLRVFGVLSSGFGGEGGFLFLIDVFMFVVMLIVWLLVLIYEWFL